MGKILSLNNAPPKCTREPGNAPVSIKMRVVLHPLPDYGKTTNEGCELLRFAPFCKKCSKTRALILKIISPQNAPKHGVFGHFEKGKNND